MENQMENCPELGLNSGPRPRTQPLFHTATTHTHIHSHTHTYITNHSHTYTHPYIHTPCTHTHTQNQSSQLQIWLSTFSSPTSNLARAWLSQKKNLKIPLEILPQAWSYRWSPRRQWSCNNTLGTSPELITQAYQSFERIISHFAFLAAISTLHQI